MGCGKEGEGPEEGEERVRGNAHEVMPTVRGRGKGNPPKEGKSASQGRGTQRKCHEYRDDQSEDLTTP